MLATRKCAPMDLLPAISGPLRRLVHGNVHHHDKEQSTARDTRAKPTGDEATKGKAISRYSDFIGAFNHGSSKPAELLTFSSQGPNEDTNGTTSAMMNGGMEFGAALLLALEDGWYE